MSNGSHAPVKAAHIPKPAPKPALTPARGYVLQRKCSCGGKSGGSCSGCQDDKLLQRRGAHQHAGPASIPSSVHSVLQSPGRPLDHSTRDFMEPRFGHDFEHVRIHSGAQAGQSARDVDARAYTVGNHIVFDDGEFSPHSHSGRQLLAHELAHTIQQHGMQRSVATLTVDHGPEYDRLERDADGAAVAALRGEPALPGPASHPTLSRAVGEVTTTTVSGKKSKSVKTERHAHKVTPSGTAEKETTGGEQVLEEFLVDPFYLPHQKGPAAFPIYEQMASGGSLNATLELQGTGKTKTALWQDRPDTDDLRDIWLQKVHWTSDVADDLWERSGGDKEFPKVNKETCQMDHIVELQIGGNNTLENIQPLDAKPNRDSGSDIKNQLQALAKAIAKDTDLSDGTARQITMRFTKVTKVGSAENLPAKCPPPKGKTRTCLAVEACAKELKVEKTSEGKLGVARVDYPIAAGGRPPTNLKVPVTFAARADEQVPIEGDSQNDPASTLIPGLLLRTLYHKKGKRANSDLVEARIDDRDKTRLPITLDEKAPPFVLNVAADGNLTLPPVEKKTALGFTYKYLSPGRITSVSVNETGGIDWTGDITPGVPFLGKLGVEYTKGVLAVTKGLDETTLKKRKVLGMQVTKAQVELQLAPELKPRGVIEMQMGSAAKPIATASLSLEADDIGLVAKGKLKVNIPKMETAETDILYKGGGGRDEWAATIHIKSENIKLGAGFSVSGELLGHIEKGMIDFDGKLDVGLPGDNSAQLGLRRGPKGDWILYGRGSFKVPRVDRVRASVIYELEKDVVTATVETKTGFTIPAIGLGGNLESLTITVTKGRKVSAIGTGRLEFKKGKAEGFAIITLLPTGKFVGNGSLTYALTPNVTVSGTVQLDANERLRVTGVLTFKRLQVLDPVKGDRTVFDVEYPIPIPGASIGNVGIQAVVGAKLDAGFQFGPVVVEPLMFEAGFNPLEDDPDLDLAVMGEVKASASAYLSASISGGVKIEAYIAEVGGKITITGTISLEGGVNIPFKGRYAKKKFTVELTPEIKLGLMLAVGLSATVWAEAGVGWLSVRTEKTWKLGERKVDTGLKLGLKAPVKYDSDTGVKLPSLNEIEFIKPDFSGDNLKRIAQQLFGDAKQSEREI